MTRRLHALITADRVAAIADAKLDAIERSFAEDKRSQSTPSERESADHKSRMQESVLSQQHRSAASLDPNITPLEMLSNPSHELTGNQNPVCQQDTSHQSEFTSPTLQCRRQPETTE
jgi:regulatory protein YycH of two-component signal transduction system YycFG